MTSPREGTPPPVVSPARMAGDALFDETFLKKLELLHIVSRKVYAGRLRAERRARKIGAGIEFADHRVYAPGDDLRYLDWGVYGRLERLLVRLFEEEEDLHVHLLLDTSASMATGTPPKLDYARQVVAALGYVALAHLDRVSILPFAADLGEPLPPARGKGRIFKVLDFLRGLRAGGETRLERAMEGFVRRTKRRGMAVVISDFYEPEGPEAALNLLRYHRFEPLVLQIVDAREARPELVGDLELVDCETGERREVTVSPRILAAVAAEHAALCRRLEAFSATHGMLYLRADTAVPFDELLLKVFRAGGFLG